ncbi:hypothetical protein BDW67DRAFT_76725 [Aspergillus spinulosporus]
MLLQWHFVSSAQCLKGNEVAYFAQLVEKGTSIWNILMVGRHNQTSREALQVFLFGSSGVAMLLATSLWMHQDS